jgi:AcrR family transcriptional regulator/DNA-binding XRE family transcriptional regulator
MLEHTTAEDSGDAVRQARQGAGLTLRQLASEVGVSVGTMSAVENGKVNITVDRLRKIAEALDAPVAQFLRPHGNAKIERQHTSDWRKFEPMDIDPVLSSAVEVFRDTGYHGATMRVIAAGADISVAGIYHHYPSKQRLLQAVIFRAHQDLEWRLDAAAKEGTDPSEAFVNMVEAVVLFREQRRSLAFVMITESSRLETTDAELTHLEYSDIGFKLEKTARRALEAQEDIKPDFGLTIRAILSMCLTPFIWSDAASAIDSDYVAQEYSKLALAMIGLNRNDHH